MNKEVRLVKLPGTDHGFRGLACQETLAEVDAFLQKHLV